MTIRVSGSTITFSDSTTQTTAFTGSFTGGGETITCAASSYTLTSADCRAIGLCFTTLPQVGCLVLPNATTVCAGGPAYVVKNLNPTTTVLVQDSCFCTIGYISPCQVGQISLYNNSTAQGSWALASGASLSGYACVGYSSFCPSIFPGTTACCKSFVDANNKIHTLAWSATTPCVCAITCAPSTNGGYTITSTSFCTCSCISGPGCCQMICTTNDGFILIDNRYSGQCCSGVSPGQYSNTTFIYAINCDSTAAISIFDNSLGNTSFCSVPIVCWCSGQCTALACTYRFNNHLHFTDRTSSGIACSVQLERTYYITTGTTSTPTISCCFFCVLINPQPAGTTGRYYYPLDTSWCSVPNKTAFLYSQLYNSCYAPGCFFPYPISHKLFCYCANGYVFLTCAACGSSQDNGVLTRICSSCCFPNQVCFAPVAYSICNTPVILLNFVDCCCLNCCSPSYITANTNGYYCLNSFTNMSCCLGLLNRVSSNSCLFAYNTVSGNATCGYMCVYWLEYCGTTQSFTRLGCQCIYNNSDCPTCVFGTFCYSGNPGMANYAYHYCDKDRGCTFANPGCSCNLTNFQPNYLLICDTASCAIWFSRSAGCCASCQGDNLAIFAYTPGSAPVIICQATLNTSCFCSQLCCGNIATYGYTFGMGTFGVICSFNPNGSSFLADLRNTFSSTCANVCLCMTSNYFKGGTSYFAGANTVLGFSSCTGIVYSYNTSTFPSNVTSLTALPSYPYYGIDFDTPSGNFLGVGLCGTSVATIFVGNYSANTNSLSINCYPAITSGCAFCCFNYSSLCANTLQLNYCTAGPYCCGFNTSFVKVKLL